MTRFACSVLVLLAAATAAHAQHCTVRPAVVSHGYANYGHTQVYGHAAYQATYYDVPAILAVPLVTGYVGYGPGQDPEVQALKAKVEGQQRELDWAKEFFKRFPNGPQPPAPPQPPVVGNPQQPTVAPPTGTPKTATSAALGDYPAMRKHCIECHGNGQRKGDLALFDASGKPIPLALDYIVDHLQDQIWEQQMPKGVKLDDVETTKLLFEARKWPRLPTVAAK